MLRSEAGTVLTGLFGDTTALFVPTRSPAAMRVSFVGPYRRAELEPAPLFDANWHAVGVDEQGGQLALAFRFAPLVLVLDSLGVVAHQRRVGTIGTPRRDPNRPGPGFTTEASDVASLAVSVRGHTVAVLYCGCAGAAVADSARLVLLLDLRDAARSTRLRVGERVRALALSPTGRALAVAFDDPAPRLEILDLDGIGWARRND